MSFSVDKKGYNIQEVDKFIADQKKSYTDKLASQQDRIFEMRQELARLEKENKAYKEKAELISKAIVNAVAKADEIEKLSELRYNEEIMHLKAFHNKWVSYYQQLIKKYPINEDIEKVNQFNSEMTKVLDNCDIDQAQESEEMDENENQYLVNDNRLKNLDPIKRIDKFFENKGNSQILKSEEESGQEREKIENSDKQVFDYNEALHPTEDLEEIMKDLGLLDD